MGRYKYIDITECKSGDYALVPIREQDILKIKNWRNAQIDVLRQKELLTTEQQMKYFKEVIKPSFLEKKPEQILFSYLYKKRCIGYGGFVHISWSKKIMEISFLVDNKRAKKRKTYEKDMTTFFDSIKKIAFFELNFSKMVAETYSFRKFHITLMERAGFKLKKVIKNRGCVNGKHFDSLIHELSSKQYHA